VRCAALLDEDRSISREAVHERDRAFLDRDLRWVVHLDQGWSDDEARLGDGEVHMAGCLLG
jgi:hypothetical protein